MQERQTLLDEAHDLCLKIPSADRVERLNLLAGILRSQNLSQAKDVVREAAETLRRRSSSGHEELSRNVVDLAYQIEPEFASTLTSLFGNDKVRQIARSRLAYQKTRESSSE